MMNHLENFCLLSGRVLLGLYFILPGIMKITNFDGMAAYMAQHNVPMVSVLLVVTIIIQLGAGTALIVGFKGKWAGLVLAGLVLAINIFMHNFWAYPEGLERGHELQNFIKNMGILAGLLIVAALGTGRFSLDNKTGADSQ